MFKPLQIIRLFQIYIVLARYTINRSVLGKTSPMLRFLSYLNPLSFLGHGETRGESIRQAIEKLGPIFVKFGQLISTRRDLLPDDIIEELTKLQDSVPPFAGTEAVKIIEKSLGKSIDELSTEFDQTALASASVAQVHAAKLATGEDVVVKVIRPRIHKVIRSDIAILHFVASLTERFWKQGKRLHPVALVKEFERSITDELDLLREAASASQLRRNFEHSDKMYVPQIYWSHTRQSIMTMERVRGVPIADIETLKQTGTNLQKLAEYGVTIFFTQVFRDSFFHADMHPGNLFVDITNPDNPKYIGVDFGIMGTLSPEDHHYLAGNILAFFNRDYRKVAVLHVESGWVPSDTRVDQFEAAIRTVCEPIFEKPLKDISFGQLLLRLFQTAERFQMEVQPQLMLLQKTLLGVEALGRAIYPDLDLWKTAKPFMANWMRKQQSLKNIGKYVASNWYENAEKMLETPALLHSVLHQVNLDKLFSKAHKTPTVLPHKLNKKKPFLYGAGVMLGLITITSIVFNLPGDMTTSQWVAGGITAGLLLLGWALPSRH